MKIYSLEASVFTGPMGFQYQIKIGTLTRSISHRSFDTPEGVLEFWKGFRAAIQDEQHDHHTMDRFSTDMGVLFMNPQEGKTIRYELTPPKLERPDV